MSPLRPNSWLGGASNLRPRNGISLPTRHTVPCQHHHGNTTISTPPCLRQERGGGGLCRATRRKRWWTTNSKHPSVHVKQVEGLLENKFTVAQLHTVVRTRRNWIRQKQAFTYKQKSASFSFDYYYAVLYFRVGPLLHMQTPSYLSSSSQGGAACNSAGVGTRNVLTSCAQRSPSPHPTELPRGPRQSCTMFQGGKQSSTKRSRPSTSLRPGNTSWGCEVKGHRLERVIICTAHPPPAPAATIVYTPLRLNPWHNRHDRRAHTQLIQQSR